MRISDWSSDVCSSDLPNPALILLDEPFNALDLDLRRGMCEDVIALLRQTGTTTVLVTHDPAEAFAVSDQIAVMHAGRIKIGRASGRERVCQYVEITVVAVAIQKKKRKHKQNEK